MTDREEFEKWFTGEEDTKTRRAMMEKDEAGYYKFQSAYNAFNAWQAATLAQQKKVEALEIQVQELQKALHEISKTRPTLSTTNEGIEVVVYFVAQNPTKIAREALSTTPNPDEWVRRDRLELCAEVIAQDDGEVTSEFISSLLIIGTKLYRIKGE